MKRILAVLLLTSIACKANDLSDAWNNLAPKSRVASGVKAAVVGLLAYEAGCAAMDGFSNLSIAWDSFDKEKFKAYDDLARAGVVIGGMGYTCFNLSYYFLFKHMKHALAVS